MVRALEGDVSLEDLNEGVRPGHSRIYGSYSGSSDYDTMQYNKDLEKFRKMALGPFTSKDYASSEYTVPASEHSHMPLVSSNESRETGETEMQNTKNFI